MAKAIVSFATRPGRGSEGGVGWAFVSQGALWAHSNSEELYVIIDNRDLIEVHAALTLMGPAGAAVRLIPVSVPAFLIKRFGDRRTRETYLGWSFGARAQAARLVKENQIDVVHQVTFASTSMPHVLPTKVEGVKTVWGPVSMPLSPNHSQGKMPSRRETLGVLALQWLGRRHARKVDLLIAQNQLTRELLSPLSSELEPNIVVDLDRPTEPSTVSQTLAMSGLLIGRKRPWLAIQAMMDPRLGSFSLNIVGDGLLRPMLEGMTHDAGLSSRVSFLGRLDREEALRIVGSARVLLHPASREGAPWAVGEAAALGVPAVVFQGSGADTTVALSANGGGIVSASRFDMVAAFVEETLAVLARPKPLPTNRWGAARLQTLLDSWWGEDLSTSRPPACTPFGTKEAEEH